MKIIFLDIDGVLNSQRSSSRCHGLLGIDDDKVERLSKIIKATNAKIVLTSTWKTDWFPTDCLDELPFMGQYLVKKFKHFGLHILSKTEDDWEHRGKGIKEWLYNFDVPVESFIILDDEWFDYDFENLNKHFIKTSFYAEPGGLQDHHVLEAIGLLNNSYL